MADFIAKEYLVKTKDGEFKIWQEGKLVDYQKWLRERTKQLDFGPTSTALVDTGMEEPLLAPPPPLVLSPVPVAKQYSLEKIVQKLIDKFALQFDQEVTRRFSHLLFSFFRGIRQSVDLRNSLQRGLGSAGLGLSDDLVDKILPVIKEIRQKIEANAGEVVSVDIQEKKLREEPGVQAEISKTKSATKAEIIAEVDRRASRVIQSQNTQSSPVSENYVVSKQSATVARSGLFFHNRRPQAVPTSKVAMDEVRRFNKLVGPVDELRQLSLDIFRRLGATPNEIVAKIGQRIGSLGEESLLDKARAIRAWQGSPVYDLYVKLGRQSLESGLPIETVIKQQLAAGQDTLHFEEFEAISDLNTKLRF